MPSLFKHLLFCTLLCVTLISQADIKSDIAKGVDLKTTVANASALGVSPDLIVKELIANKVDSAQATIAVIEAYPAYIHVTSITRAAIGSDPFGAPKIVVAAIKAASEFENDITKVAVDAAPSSQQTIIKTEAVKATPPFVNLTKLSELAKSEPEKTERQIKENADIGLAGVVLATKGRVTAINAKGETRVLIRQSKFFDKDIIKTDKESSAQLRFEDRALMGLRENSELNIKEYRYAGSKAKDNQAVMQLVSGGFRTISGTIGKADKSAYSVSTAAATIGIRGTDYEVIIALDGKVIAAAWDGTIRIENDLGALEIGAGSSYIFAAFGKGSKPAGTEQMPKEFAVGGSGATALNNAQKAKLKAFLANTEVSEEIQDFLDDLDEAESEEADEEKEVIEQELEAINTDPIPVIKSPN